MSYRASYFHGGRFFRCAFLQCTSFQCASLIAIVAWSLLSNGCSGGSAPGSSSVTTTPTSTGSSTASLSVSATLPGATVGTAYNSTITVTGGTSPYAFSVASGALPGGVALGATSGSVSGTPTASGNFSFAVSVTDSTGLSKQQPLQIAVASVPTPAPPPTTPSAGPSGGNSFSAVQDGGGWAQYGQRAPTFVDCSPSPCNGISFSMTQGVSSPSLSGKATEYYVGGNVPFSDALFNNHLIGADSTQGMPDANQTVVPSLHDFTYDVYFYGDNLGLSQALEFDINQFFGGMGFIFGHECRIAGGNEWDVWDNQNAYWKHTGIPCNPSNSWNHLTLKVQRTSNNQLVYQSITLNGFTSNLNWSFPAGSAPGWYGVTINYQMDGDENQDSYNVYLDNLTFSYQ